MIGIYKYTNKTNGKCYIGQSIHCGKRFDEHYAGGQYIDQVLREEGIDNFTYEILTECNKNELDYWEDYYIAKYNSMYPNGYNKRWNCSSKKHTSNSSKCYPNQLHGHICKPNYKELGIPFISIDTEEMRKASINLSPSAFKLFLCFVISENNQEYNFSPKSFQKEFNISESTYWNAKKELIKKGYLIKKDNNIIFHSNPKI